MKIEIQNLKCGGCAATIKKELERFPELRSVEVDVEHNVVHFETDQASQLPKYEAALRSIGYPPVGQDNPLLKQAQSYVSCAIGRFGEKV